MSNWGCAGLPFALTPFWPGKTIDVASGSVLCRITVTGFPDVTHRTGPGSWNRPELIP